MLMRYLLPGVAAVALITGAGWWVYNKGYSSGYDAHVDKIAEETVERQKGFDKAMDALREADVAFNLAEQDRDELERTRSDEAAQDPLADSPALSADSLLRLNRIR